MLGLNKLFSPSFDDEDQYEEEMYDQYSEEYEEEYDDESSFNGSKNIININGDDKSTVVVVEPRSVHDACALVQIIKENKICVGKFDSSNSDEMQKIVDFISGAVYALNADMEKISDEIFIVVPANVEIKKTMKEEVRASVNPFSFKKK